MKAVVVTGVSSGIGEAISRHLAQHGYTVFGSVRAPEHAHRLKADLGPRFIPLVFDVTDQCAVTAAAKQVADQVQDHGLRGLVNNAGIAVTGPLMHMEIEDFRRQFEINLFGVLTVTQAFLPLLGARSRPPHPPGRILNMSSGAVSVVFPFAVPYVASKQALEALSHGLRRELQVFGIDVVIVAPGVVSTPIWEKMDKHPPPACRGTPYQEALEQSLAFTQQVGEDGMPMERVTHTVREALEAPRPQVRYAIPIRRLSARNLLPWIPARWLDRLIGRRLGLRPRP